MLKKIACAFGLAFVLAGSIQAEVLIIADEFPAMQAVADKLKSEEGIESRLIWQTNLPPSLKPFEAVIVYIHKDLSPRAEMAMIEYVEGGGKLVALHHSISSGKRRNARWFSFLGVKLPDGDVSQGGYKWTEGVSWELVNLNPSHFIMTNKVVYPARISYGTNGELPGFRLEKSEVYVNHGHEGPRTLLMGLKYTDEKTGVTYLQDRAGWVKLSGRGTIVYLMPGHTRQDFENSAYGRIVVNAVVYKPGS